MGYQLLPTEYGVVFDIAPFNNQLFQKSGQLIGTTSLDSGWGSEETSIAELEYRVHDAFGISRLVVISEQLDFVRVMHCGDRSQ